MERSAHTRELEDCNNKDVLLTDVKFNCRRSEMEWTKQMIEKCLGFINIHKDNLRNFLDEKDVLIKKKSRLKGYNVEEEMNNCDIDDNMAELSKEAVENLNKLRLFSDFYEISSLSKGDNFYQSIIDRLSRNLSLKFIYYHNQTFIPNELKIISLARKMLLYKIDVIGEYLLNEIIRQPVNMSVDLHISSGTGQLLSVRGEDPCSQYHVTAMGPNMSYFIDEAQTVQTRFILMVMSTPMVIALDIYHRDDPTNEIVKLSIPNGYSTDPNVNYPKSFTKRNLTTEEIRQRLIFLDASFAIDIDDNLIPVAITAVDYRGFIIENTTICPRTIIRNYCPEWHGLRESDLIGKSDVNETLNDFYESIWDKILVGYNLEFKIKALKIDMRWLCGTRELQGSSALKRFMDPGTESWSLNEISERILKTRIETMSSLAETNAFTIRNIYGATESYWPDTETETNKTSVWPSLAGDNCRYNETSSDRYQTSDFFGAGRR